MVYEALLGELKGINGYLASAILDAEGGSLAVDTTTEEIDPDKMVAACNEIFLAAHTAAGKMEFASTNELVIQTTSGMVVTTCTGGPSTPHLHIVCILSKDGNQALAKMTMHKIGPRAVAELG